MILAPEVETRPWVEQLALDDLSYRAQLTYVFERSAFYRRKLEAAGFSSPESAGGPYILQVTGAATAAPLSRWPTTWPKAARLRIRWGASASAMR